MIYLDDKAPADVADYVVDMTGIVPDGFSIDTLDVEIIDSGNGESPLGLTVSDTSSRPLAGGEEKVVVLLRLAGGTPGVRYLGRMTMGDDGTSPPGECVRLFQVEVEPL